MADKSFVMYDAWSEMVEDMTEEEAGRLLKAIYAYRKDKNNKPQDRATRLAFNILKQRFDEDDVKYREKVEKRIEAGKQGGRPKKQTKAKKANAFSESKPKQKNPDNEFEYEYEYVNDNGFVNDNESLTGHNKTSCSEQSSEPVPDCEALILNDGSDWYPSVEMFAEYQRLYPGVDIQQQFRAMRSWCLGNPKKRKTKSGINRFVTSWLSKEQNRGRASPIFAENKFAVADAWARGEL